MNEQDQNLVLKNPFGEGSIINKLIDENGRSHLQMVELLKNNIIRQENEWYVLFENGTLVKKGRSKTSTSEYVNGSKRHKSIIKFYGTV